MVSYTLEGKGYLLESGSPFGISDTENPPGNADPIMPQVPGDEIIAHFGSGINLNDDRIKTAPVQHSYKNIGSFWTWYPPAFMVDFNQHFPSCTTLPILDMGGGNPSRPLICHQDISTEFYNGSLFTFNELDQVIRFDHDKLLTTILSQDFFRYFFRCLFYQRLSQYEDWQLVVLPLPFSVL